MKYYLKNKREVLDSLNVDENLGLCEKEVEIRQEKYGLNEFTQKQQESLLENIKDSLKEPMIIILIVAAIISGIIGQYHDAIGIIIAVAVGVGIGIVTEGKSKKAADALSKLSKDIEIKVIRDGKISNINKSSLVPGDIVFIETGDSIPADGRLIYDMDLKVREDVLTGEADEVHKDHSAIVSMKKVIINGREVLRDPIPANQINMVFGGTQVAYGRGKMVVTSTGDLSEMGKIAANLGEKEDQTPLQIKLGNLGTKIAKISSVVASLLFIYMVVKMMLNNTINLDTKDINSLLYSIVPAKTAFITCVALIVAAVPEGLPTMVNMTLAITMQKMAKINALVTKKEACETIGSVSVICSDKTGTLTENKMTVGKLFLNGRYVMSENYEDEYFIKNCFLNSTAHIEFSQDKYKYLGSATECALLLYNKHKDYIKERENTKLLFQIPFSSKNKMMSSIVEGDGEDIILTKGAPEIILDLCKFENVNGKKVALTDERKKFYIEEIKNLQDKSMRALGFGYKTISRAETESALAIESISKYNDLIFNGFAGIKDPLRKDVKEAVKIAKKAGVSVKMLTGDNINTAIAIGEELGLLKNNMKAVESYYIDSLSDDELKREINNIAIVGRSKPDTKLRIVKALQDNEEVVAVTGDGINDAPALHKADVGIAMGITGTEVSKSAADIILTDDSFRTIVSGIKWGRGIYENFQRFIQFQLTVNVVAFLIAIVSQLLGRDMPFTTVQLLWVNIIMDGPPALALGLEPVRDVVLKRKPINKKESIINKTMISSILFNAIYITSLLIIQMIYNPLGAKISTEAFGTFAPNEMETVLFGLFSFLALFNAFNCREIGNQSIFKYFTKNKVFLKIITIVIIAQIFFTEVFKGFFNSVALSLTMWIKIILVGMSIILVNEIIKLILRVNKQKNKKI